MGKRLILRIRFKRRTEFASLLGLAIFIPVFLLILVLNRSDVFASPKFAEIVTITSARQYYLTKEAVYTGQQAPNACADGYHFASFWEILDTSNLAYNVGSGKTTTTSVVYGWVRTGYTSDNGVTAGQANCNAWSSSTGNGTTIGLPNDWSLTPDFLTWNVQTSSCSTQYYVWCVEDNRLEYIYLPLVLR